MISRLDEFTGGFFQRTGTVWLRFERRRSTLIAFLALSPAFLFLVAGLFKLALDPSGQAELWREPRWAILGFLFQVVIIAGPILALILTLLPPIPVAAGRKQSELPVAQAPQKQVITHSN